MAKASKQQVEELEFLREQERLLVREQAREDFWTFLTMVLWEEESKEHLEEGFHKPIADRITAAQPGCRDLLLAPRMSRKTMVRTVAHAIWRIVRDPNVRILVISALDATAVNFVETIKRLLQHNKGLRYYFPEAALPLGKVGTVYEFTHPARTNLNLNDPTLRSTYLGAPFVGRRADIVIMDDPIDDKHVATPEQADKALRWVNAIEPLIDRNPTYNMAFVQGTRKSYNDVFGAMLGEDRVGEAKEGLEAPPYQGVVIASLQDEEGKPAFDGEPVFPKVLSRAVLMQLLAQARMDPQQGENYWWREMMNVIEAPGQAKFLPEWFDTWIPALPPVAWSGLLVDSAVKDQQLLGRGDFSVILAAHMDNYGNVYFTDGARSDRWRAADLMRELVGMAQRANTFNIVKEKVGESFFFPMVQEYFAKQRLPCTTYPLNVAQEGKKVVRIVGALQAPAQARKIYFVGSPQGGSGFPVALHKVLVDEATHIGMWGHDDVVDAASTIYHKDIRVIPSINRPVEWRVPTGARLQQPSTPRFNVGALRQRPSPQVDGDGTLRGTDPFVADLLEGLGGMGEERGRRQGSGFGFQMPIVRGPEDV